MSIRVAINGFGRIGRTVLKAGIDDPDIEWVAVNDLTDAETLAHLFKYDSVFGVYKGESKHNGDHLDIGGRKIKVLAQKDPEKLPWKKLKIDVVVESTGLFRTPSGAEKHIKAGAKKVVVSAPCKCENKTCPPEEVKTIVKGVNEHTYNPKKHVVISNASCTTNCAAPVIKVLDDKFGIRKGFLTTVHGYTSSQKVVDAPHKDWRRGRAAAVNIVPTTTGAAIAVTETMPHLIGKLDGIAIRVPVIDGSVTDFTLELDKKTTVKEVNKLFKSVARKKLKGVLEYTEEELVSTDIIGNPHSAIFDAKFTKILDGNLLKVLAWYDNEWGYSNRMVDVIKLVGKGLK